MKKVIAETGYEFVKDSRFNTINIYVDARPESDLSWESLDIEIETALKLQASLSFELDFGFAKEKALLRDSATFFSRSVAIAEFEKRVYTKYKEKIAAIILYRGSGDFKESIEGDTSLYVDFLEWKQELFGTADLSFHMFRLFSMELFMHYLHRLAAPLIEEIPLVALFDFSDVKKPAHQAELLSASFFPYIVPGVKGSRVAFRGFGWEEDSCFGYIGHKVVDGSRGSEPKLGVVLPNIGSLPYDLFDHVLASLQDKNISYHIFPEALMTDHWHGLDHILVFSDHVTDEGIRMLQGFNAADGKVVVVGRRLNLLEEMSQEEFIRSRGI